MSEALTIDQRIKASMDGFEGRFCVRVYPFTIMKLMRSEATNLKPQGSMTLGIMMEDSREQIQATTNISGITGIFDRDVRNYGAKQEGDGWQFLPAEHEKNKLKTNMFVRDFTFR